MNVSDQLLDLLTVRLLLTERIIAGQNVELNEQLNSIAANIEKALKGKELTEYQGKRLDKAISELASMVRINAPDLAGFAASEASFINSAFVSIGLDTVVPAANVVAEVAKSAVMQGGTMAEWFGQLNEAARFNLSRTVKNGVLLGLTNSQIAKTIVGKGDKGSEPIAKARRDGMAIVRTATQTVANDVRMASYAENADIIKSVQWVATLDSRTSDICIARSGKTWSFPDLKPQGHSIPWNNGPPAHWACRSTSVPVTRSMAEITGKAEDKIAPRTRASMDGEVAQDLTFDDFLKGKSPEFADEMLGKGRAELWRSGKITLNQLLDQRGNPLTLAQLQARYGTVKAPDAPAAPKAAAPKPAPKPAPVNDIDATIAAVKAFKYSDELENTQKLIQQRKVELQAIRDSEFTTGRAVAIRDGIDKVFDAQERLNVLEALERKRLLQTIALPSSMRGSADYIITGNVNPKYRKSVREASELVSMLVHRDIMPMGVKVRGVSKDRAYYMANIRTIHINQNTPVSTIVHEIVHDIEYSHPDVSTKTKAFLAKRAKGEPTQRLRDLTGNYGYGLSEVAYKDEWEKRGGSHYMGKLYPRASTELLTMGVERMIADPKEFADKDPEYFRFMLEILRRAN